MSPSEFDLRAALREGEGDLPDAGRIIATASRARYERRRRIISVASGVGIAAVVVTGFTLLVRIGSGREDGGGSAGGVAASVPAFRDGSRPQAAEESTPPSAGSRSAAASQSLAVTCPTTFPQQALPGGGGTDQFGADEPLFRQPVAAMEICAYGAGRGNQSLELGTRDAQRFATVLQTSPTKGDGLACLFNGPRFAIYPITTSGAMQPVVTAVPGCKAYHVTNGTAVRVVPVGQFDPVDLGRFLPSQPPLNRGSPIKS